MTGERWESAASSHTVLFDDPTGSPEAGPLVPLGELHQEDTPMTAYAAADLQPGQRAVLAGNQLQPTSDDPDQAWTVDQPIAAGQPVQFTATTVRPL